MDTMIINQCDGMFDRIYSVEGEVQFEDSARTSKTWIARIIKEEALQEEQIVEVITKYKNKDKRLSVSIKCDKPEKREFEELPVKDKILTILLKMRYRKKSVKEIKQGIMPNFWHVKLHDKPYAKAQKTGRGNCSEIERRIKNTVQMALEHKYVLFFEFV